MSETEFLVGYNQEAAKGAEARRRRSKLFQKEEDWPCLCGEYPSPWFPEEEEE